MRQFVGEAATVGVRVVSDTNTLAEIDVVLAALSTPRVGNPGRIDAVLCERSGRTKPADVPAQT